MKKALGLVAAFGLVLSASAAGAGETWGKITAVDPKSGTFTLADGTQVTVSDQQLGGFTLGDNVTMSYEIKDGKKVITNVAPDRMYEIQGD